MTECRTNIIDAVEITIEMMLAIPSFAIYFFLIHSYRHRRPRILNDSFFTLYVLNATLSMIFYLFNLVFLRAPGIGIFCDDILQSMFAQPSYWLSPMYFLLYYLPYTMLFSNTLMSLNRMCSVIFITNNTQTWSPSLTRISIIIIFLLPLPMCWHLLISPAYYDDVLNGLGLQYIRVIKYTANSLLNLITHLTCAILCSLFTLATAARMMTMIKRHKKNEVSLLIVGAVQSIGVLLAAAHQLYMFIEFSPILYQKRFVIVDYQCFCSAWTLLVLSANVRKEICRSILQQTNAVKSSLVKHSRVSDQS